jgi:hypothetical protein
MPDITIDADKAERMIAEILRTEKRFLPADANAMAANICRRLKTAMPAPTNQALQGYRLIRRWPPSDSGFTTAVGEKIADVNDRVAATLWQLVYDRARELPATMADSTDY